MLGLVLLAGLRPVMSNLVVAGDISASWQQYIDVLNIIKNGIFAYLALYTGINSAEFLVQRQRWVVLLGQ